MDFLIKPFSWFLEVLCNAFQSYPIAIILFTVIVNVALIPFNLKQQKNMAKQVRLRPKLEELKQKCGDDKMKYQTAMQEIYQKENVSPTGGCLPMIIRLVIIMLVYYGLMDILNITTNAAGDRVMGASAIPAEYFNLFGLDLRLSPHFTTNIAKKDTTDFTWVIPIVCFLAQMMSIVISNKQQAKTNPQVAEQGGSMKLMMFIMPAISLIFTFQVTCALGFYWIFSSIVNTAITVTVNTFYSPDKILAREMIENGNNRRNKENKIIETTK